MRKTFITILFLVVFIINYTVVSYCADIEVPVWASSTNSIEQVNNSNSNETMLTNADEQNETIASSITTNEASNEFNINAIQTSGNVNNSISNNEKMENQDITSIKTNSDLKQNAPRLDNIPGVEQNNPLNLTCGGAILIEQNSGNILYDYNMHEKLRPASVTKVMTLLLIMEAIDNGEISLTDKVPCTEESAKMGGSQIWLDTTEELTVDEMLKAICVVSANDCTVAMANYIAGSQEAFVEKMNNRAKELGMNDTTFKNCHGIDEDGHVTSAYDIAVMSRELLMNHPTITKYTTIYMDYLRDGKSQLVNTNKLVRNYEGCTGLKTGSTSVALFNLSASATRNGLSLIAVIMRADTSKVRFNEASKLLNYGFGNYQFKQMAKRGEKVGEVVINKGIKNVADACFENDFGIIVQKNDKQEIEQSIEIYNNIFAPIQLNQKVGEVKYKIDGKEIGCVNLVASEFIDKYGFISMTTKIFKMWFGLLR